MVYAGVTVERRRFGQTLRRDPWWIAPLVVFICLSTFVVYSTWAAFQGVHYAWGPYLSPFYSPLLYGDPALSWFGARPNWVPIGLSPALLILWVPAGFRLTCYYYRGAYYKAFWADPPSCAVGEPRKKYLGESTFPLILQNIHRYFLVLAFPFLFFLAHDAWKSLWWVDTATGGERFGMGIGSLVLTANVVMLGGYAFGCHSLRHLIGGRVDEVSKSALRYKAYGCSSCLNRRHMMWAWLSLFSVGFSDLYVRLVSMGVWTDWRIF